MKQRNEFNQPLLFDTLWVGRTNDPQSCACNLNMFRNQTEQFKNAGK
jgi:hypothetical protein